MGQSKPSQSLKEIITFFGLNNTPKEIHQKNILQNTFKFCDPLECFTQFRLVCKSWQRAVEDMKFHSKLDLEDIVKFEQNGKYPIFYCKYVQAFKKIAFFLNENVLEKW